MGTARRRRLAATAATAASIAVHALVLTLFALHAPRLVVPHEEAGPPEPIIPVLIMPRSPPPAPGARPQPIRLHRRQLRPEIPLVPPIPPLIVPPPPVEGTPARPGPGALPRTTVQPSPSAQLRNALRAGPVGCANPTLLTPAERSACDEQFGRNTPGAPVLPPAPSAASRAALGQAAGAKEARQRDKRAGVPNGLESPLGGSGASYGPALEPEPAPPRLRP